MTKFVLSAIAAAAVTTLTAGAARATPIAGPHSVSAFYSDDDRYLHAIVAQTNGDVREVYYVAGSFHYDSVIAHFDTPIAAVGSYYTSSDHLRHVIVALQNRQIWEVYFNPQVGISKTYLTTAYGDPLSVAAWSDGTTGWFGVLVHDLVAPGYWENANFVYQMSGHVAVSEAEIGAATVTDPNARPIAEIAGTGMIFGGPRDAFVYAETLPNGDWYSSLNTWWQPASFNDVGAVKSTIAGYPAADLPVSSAALSNYFGDNLFASNYKPFVDLLEITPSNQLVELAAGTPSTPSVGWTFLYGPTALSLGAALDPYQAVKHAPVMMSNGDLWDMHAPMKFGSAWSYDYLGRY